MRDFIKRMSRGDVLSDHHDLQFVLRSKLQAPLAKVLIFIASRRYNFDINIDALDGAMALQDQSANRLKRIFRKRVCPCQIQTSREQLCYSTLSDKSSSFIRKVASEDSSGIIENIVALSANSRMYSIS
jgi:hypothetical protein